MNGGTWWTEARAMWAEAIALFLILALDLVLAFFDIRERKEARQERAELQRERQRNDVTCLGVRVYGGYPGPGTTVEQICADMWKHHSNHQPGFAIYKESYIHLPGHLLRKCEPFSSEIARHTSAINIPFLVFKFPYGDYEALLEDLRILNLGEKIVAWDENGHSLLGEL